MLYVQQDYNLKRMKIMADNNQNKAEQYRQERKERLAKSAKKNAKNIEKKVAARSAVKKVIAIIVIAAIALGCVTGILNYCGVLQKAVQVGYVGNEKISYAEYLYYYSRAYNQLSYNAQYYKYYGYDYGYDTSLAPQDQTSQRQTLQRLTSRLKTSAKRHQPQTRAQNQALRMMKTRERATLSTLTFARLTATA